LPIGYVANSVTHSRSNSLLPSFAVSPFHLGFFYGSRESCSDVLKQITEPTST